MLNEEKDFKLDKTTGLRMPLAMLAAIIVACASVGIAAAVLRNDVTLHTEKLRDHEQRIRGVEDAARAMPVMANDIQWIRHELENRRKNPTP